LDYRRQLNERRTHRRRAEDDEVIRLGERRGKQRQAHKDRQSAQSHDLPPRWFVNLRPSPPTNVWWMRIEETTMLTRATTFAAAATIGLSAYISLPSTSANAGPVRAVVTMKVKEASKLRLPPRAQNGRSLGRYNRMFEMYSR